MYMKDSDTKSNLIKYNYENKGWLEELSKHADPYIRAMAITIIKNALD